MLMTPSANDAGDAGGDGPHSRGGELRLPPPGVTLTYGGCRITARPVTDERGAIDAFYVIERAD